MGWATYINATRENDGEPQIVITYAPRCSCGWEGDTVFTHKGAHALYLIHLEHKHPSRWHKLKKLRVIHHKLKKLRVIHHKLKLEEWED